jgi:hypothetical protein
VERVPPDAVVLTEEDPKQDAFALEMHGILTG